MNRITMLSIVIAVRLMIHQPMLAQWTDNGSKLTTTDSVGIGTGTNVMGKFHVKSGTTEPAVVLQTSLPSSISEGENLGQISWWSNKGPGTVRSGIYSFSDSAWVSVGSQSLSSRLSFWTSHGTTLAERMRIDRLGNVGIGTTTPAYTLDVDGDVFFHENVGVGTAPGSSASQALTVWGTNELTDLIVSSTDPMRLSSGLTGAVIEFGSKLKIQDASTQTPIIFADENQGEGPLVGIGTTSPQAELDVAGKARMTSFQLTSGAGSGYHLMSDANGVGTWNSEIVGNGGNIGIGTTTPAYKLDVDGDLYIHEQLGIGTSPSSSLSEPLKILGTNDLTKLIVSSLDPMTISSGVGGSVVEFGTKFTIQDASTQTPIIFADENQGEGPIVGIGTTTPQAELDVAGTVRTTSFELTSGAGSGYYLTSDLNGLAIWSSAIVENGGKIGIGTSSPSELLHVAGIARFDTSFQIMTPNKTKTYTFQTENTGANPVITFPPFSGSVALADGGQDLTNIGNITASTTMHLLGPGSGQEGGQINLANATNQTGGEPNSWTIDNASNDLRVFYNSGAVRFFIDDATGNVGVGTSTPGTDKLAVNGTVKAQDIILTLDGWQTNPGQGPNPEGSGADAISGTPSPGGWPDFVFDEEYDLMPLDELGRVVRDRKHLPGIPTAEEVAANGIQMGELQGRLLQKIEELTLYVIDLKKENDHMKQRLGVLEQK